VDKHFRVLGTDNLFCLGDPSSVEESKQAVLAGMHGELVAKNFRAILKSGAKAKLGAWKPNMGMSVVMLVSLGRDEGVMQVGSMACSGCIPTNLKSRGFAKFVKKYRDQALSKK
jgi:NADH dehydrogenase FAD-containing subunit